MRKIVKSFKLPEQGASSVEILQATRRILKNEKRWIKRSFYQWRFRGSLSKKCLTRRANVAELADQCCLSGAVYVAAKYDQMKSCRAEYFIRLAVAELFPRSAHDGVNIPNFNDARHRTHQDILRVLDRAIELAEEDVAHYPELYEEDKVCV